MTTAVGHARGSSESEPEILVDDSGRPYDLGPRGFVCDLNTRAVKIARRIARQHRRVEVRTPKPGLCSDSPESTASSKGRWMVCTIEANNIEDSCKADNSANTEKLGVSIVQGDASGTVRTVLAQEIQFVLSGRLPFVKRWEIAVWTWVSVSAYFILRYGFLESGFALTLASFTVMYVVLDFYSGVLHVVLDDEWNMKVPFLSQPAMEFQYHHHIPDDGCSRPFVEGMGDLNVIIGIHLALFTAIFIHGGCKDALLLCSGAWKMLIAYWGIWNHRQVSLFHPLFDALTSSDDTVSTSHRHYVGMQNLRNESRVRMIHSADSTTYDPSVVPYHFRRSRGNISQCFSHSTSLRYHVLV